MTLQEANQLAWLANQPSCKAFIEWAEIHQAPTGDYSVIIEPIQGKQQIHSDATTAGFAI